MNSLSVLGKYVDQPRFVKGVKKAMPYALIGGGVLYAANDIRQVPDSDKKKETIKNIAVLAITIASALAAPKIAAKVVKGGHHHHHHAHVDVHAPHSGEHHSHHYHEEETYEDMLNEFLEENKVGKDVEGLLNKAKTKMLSFSEIKKVFTELGKNPKADELLNSENGLVPAPEHIDSNHILKCDLPKLSVLGLIPVLGGIAGGILGDKITENDWKKRIPDKIKEGSYQYLANICLCNVGAGVALLGMEKAKIQSKAVRAIGMVGGIILAGVVFGSAVANYIGNKFINPLLDRKHKNEHLYDERKPELLDISLHVDDIATVAVLSGLKWIEPALPVLYAVSGYRAGIGYRNGEEAKSKH